MFLGAALIFQTKRVPPEAAAISIWPALFIATFLRLKKTGRGLADIKLSLQRDSFTKLILGFLLGATFMIIAFALLNSSNAITVQKQVLSNSLILGSVIGLAYSMVQAGTEEVIFRGYLFKTLAFRSKNFAILISAALFSLVHFWHGVDLIGWFNIFLFGVFAAQLVMLTNNLWTAIGFHVGWNYFQKTVIGFPVYGKINSGLFQTTPSFSNGLTGGDYGPEGSLIITVLLIVGIGLIYLRGRGPLKISKMAPSANR